MTIDVLEEVAEERQSQDDKWGEQNHTPSRYFDILMEEVGEVAKALVEAQAYTDQDDCISAHNWWTEYRKELVHVAAVAVAMVESFDREEDQRREK